MHRCLGDCLSRLYVFNIFSIGFTNKKLKENNATVSNSSVSISIPSIRTLLFKNIVEGKRKSPKFTIKSCGKQFLLSTNALATDELFGRYGLNRVQLLLQTYDNEIPLSKAVQLANISIHDAKVLTERASEVAAGNTCSIGALSSFCSVSISMTSLL